MLVCYLFWSCIFLYVTSVVAANASCCNDMITSGTNETNNHVTGAKVTSYDVVPPRVTSHKETMRSNMDTNVGRGESEARWWLVPYYGPYYEFYVNEYSYKFWAAFQLATVAILLYSAFAAIYFAKYTFLTQVDNIKEDDLLFWWRSFQSREFQGLDASTYQRIMDAIHPT